MWKRGGAGPAQAGAPRSGAMFIGSRYAAKISLNSFASQKDKAADTYRRDESGFAY